MVTSPYKWMIFEWDVKSQTKNQFLGNLVTVVPFERFINRQKPIYVNYFKYSTINLNLFDTF